MGFKKSTAVIFYRTNLHWVDAYLHVPRLLILFYLGFLADFSFSAENTSTQVKKLCSDLFQSLGRYHISLDENFLEENGEHLGRKSFLNFLNTLSQSGTLLSQVDFQRFQTAGEDSSFLQRLKEGDFSFIRQAMKLIASRVQEMKDCLTDVEGCLAFDENETYRYEPFRPKIEFYPLDEAARKLRMVNRLRYSVMRLVRKGISIANAINKLKAFAEGELLFFQIEMISI